VSRLDLSLTPEELEAVAATAGRSADTVLLTLRFATGVAAHSLYTWDTPAVAAEAECDVDVYRLFERLADDVPLLTAITAPSAASYYRLRPNRWAPAVR